MVAYLLPVVGIVLGAIVLGDPVTLNRLAGTALVIAGIALVNSGAAVRRYQGRNAEPVAHRRSPSRPRSACRSEAAGDRERDQRGRPRGEERLEGLDDQGVVLLLRQARRRARRPTGPVPATISGKPPPCGAYSGNCSDVASAKVVPAATWRRRS